MKKLFVLLLALTVVGAAFAQVNFTGYLDTGVEMFIEGDLDPTFGLDADDAGQDSRFNLAGAYTKENVGVTFRYRVQNDFDASKPAVFLNRGYVWATMFDGMAKVVAGRLGDYTWSTAGNDIGNLDTKTGVQLQIMPMEGLNFGFFIPAATTKVAFEDVFPDMVIGAAYDMEGLGGFRAGVDLGLDVVAIPEDAKTTMVWFGAEITAVENFVFYLDYQGSNLGTEEIVTDGTDFWTAMHYLWWEVDYTMDALNVGIDLEQMFFGFEDAPLGLSFGPYAAYTLDKITLGADFVYYMTTETDLVDSQSGTYIHPYVQFAVGPGAVIELGAKLNSGDISGIDIMDPDAVLTDNTTKIYVDFTWSF